MGNIIPLTKWVISSYKGGIDQVEVISETKCYITIQSKQWDGKPFTYRILKDGVVFNTFEEAKAALMGKAKRGVIEAEASLQRAKSQLQKINSLREKGGRARS